MVEGGKLCALHLPHSLHMKPLPHPPPLTSHHPTPQGRKAWASSVEERVICGFRCDTPSQGHQFSLMSLLAQGKWPVRSE